MTDIAVDFDNLNGTIKPMHGVCNGPVCYGSLVDVSSYYRELGVPYVRLHDTNWPHPREVDIPQIFTNFDADADDPASYDFRRTDDYLQSILDTGAKIVYRLGTSIEHTKRKYYVHPPSDAAKWARVCVNVIRHYNNGWASGFQHGIQHWEIWNEPDNDPNAPPEKKSMWSGTPEQYFDLYKETALAIKAFDPALQVGGFAATSANPTFNEQFIAYCEANKLPLDFFSWHTYAAHPMRVISNSLAVRRMLDDHSYTATASHFNEWNYAKGDPDTQGFFGDNEYSRMRMYERAKGEEGASFAAAVLISLQDCPVDVANFYDAAPTSWWSLFNQYGVPQKNYYAFRMFRELLNTPERAEAEVVSAAHGLYVLAGTNRETREAALMISNFDGEARQYEFSFAHLPREASICEVYLLDKTRSFAPVLAWQATGSEAQDRLHLEPHSVALIRFR